MIRPIPFTLGVIVLGAAWFLLASVTAFYHHMTAHMLVVAIAAPMLALGLTESVWNPAHHIPALAAPLLASLLELGVVWAWHTPVLHELARRNSFALVAEQTSFLAAGLYLWISVIAGRLQKRQGEGIVALLLTAIHMTLLGALLALAPRPLYGHLHDPGIGALDDQHLGGAIMILVGGASYLFGGLCLSWNLLHYRRV